MKNIRIVQAGISDAQFFNSANRDNCSDPYITLRENMRQRGYSLTVLGNESVRDSEWILFFDATSVKPPSVFRRFAYSMLSGPAVSKRNVYRECVQLGLAERVALFLWEGPVVLPANWNTELHSRFPVVFTWCDNLVDGVKVHKVHWPQTRRYPSIQPRSFVSKKLLVNISMNKASRRPAELYSERRAAIRYFERSMPNEFDLYGVGWDQPLGIQHGMARFRPHVYTSYRGTVPNKWEIFPNYRFSICYENILNAPGYITEKIFDCMRSDCVPIYLGASNIEDYIPKEAFIDRRRFGSYRELELFLRDMSENNYNRYREAIADFLKGTSFANFLEDTFADTICRVLKLDGNRAVEP